MPGQCINRLFFLSNTHSCMLLKHIQGHKHVFIFSTDPNMHINIKTSTNIYQNLYISEQSELQFRQLNPPEHPSNCITNFSHIGYIGILEALITSPHSHMKSSFVKLGCFHISTAWCNYLHILKRTWSNIRVLL